jgi:hypothetical protein
MSAAKINYDKEQREIRQVEHLVCALDKENRYACFMKLPLNNVIDQYKEPAAIWQKT